MISLQTQSLISMTSRLQSTSTSSVALSKPSSRSADRRRTRRRTRHTLDKLHKSVILRLRSSPFPLAAAVFSPVTHDVFGSADGFKVNGRGGNKVTSTAAIATPGQNGKRARNRLRKLNVKNVAIMETSGQGDVNKKQDTEEATSLHDLKFKYEWYKENTEHCDPFQYVYLKTICHALIAARHDDNKGDRKNMMDHEKIHDRSNGEFSKQDDMTRHISLDKVTQTEPYANVDSSRQEQSLDVKEDLEDRKNLDDKQEHSAEHTFTMMRHILQNISRNLRESAEHVPDRTSTLQLINMERKHWKMLLALTVCSLQLQEDTSDKILGSDRLRSLRVESSRLATSIADSLDKFFQDAQIRDQYNERVHPDSFEPKGQHCENHVFDHTTSADAMPKPDCHKSATPCHCCDLVSDTCHIPDDVSFKSVESCSSVEMHSCKTCSAMSLGRTSYRSADSLKSTSSCKSRSCRTISSYRSVLHDTSSEESLVCHQGPFVFSNAAEPLPLPVSNKGSHRIQKPLEDQAYPTTYLYRCPIHSRANYHNANSQ